MKGKEEMFKSLNIFFVDGHKEHYSCRVYLVSRDYFSFSVALDLLKAEKKVAREGWNGKGMFIYLQTGSVINAGTQGRNAVLRAMAGDVKIHPHIDMKAADGSIIIGWAATQTDMLAEDWYIVE